MDQDRINRYWTDRAEEFSGLRMRDYDSVMKANYAEIFQYYLRDFKGRRVLDLGTGAGFFSLILAELGYQIVGVDYSEDMLQCAEKNRQLLGLEGIEFRQMDAHQLEFESEQFDLVVSRNVTWTLLDPQKAYQEMVRVLKPDGIIMNFDANYGRAFQNAESRNEKPMHPTQTDEQLIERNQIAKSLYICEKNRPYWDMQILEQLGIHKFRLDLLIDRWICKGSSKEELYQGIPKGDTERFFLLYAEK